MQKGGWAFGKQTEREVWVKVSRQAKCSGGSGNDELLLSLAGGVVGREGERRRKAVQAQGSAGRQQRREWE